MSLDQTLRKLLESNNFSNNLPEIQKTIQQLNINPSYPIILIGGTNGKGSVCAYLSTILVNAGYLIGTFTSPHVLDYNERIQINNSNVDDDTLNEALTTVLQTYHKITNSNDIGLFKAFTLAAHLIFAQKKIDIAIVEVGIGGKNDVTNLFEPLISAITNIDFDHRNILGNTLDEIGIQKAGIYRKDKWALFGNVTIPNSIIQQANLIGAKLQIFGKDFILQKDELSISVHCNNKNYFSLPYPALRGIKQADNAALAIAILDKLSSIVPVGLNHIKSGLLTCSLIGRFQVLPGLPQTIVDVAHNPPAVTHLLENVLKLPSCKNTYAIFGIANDKDIEQISFSCRNVFSKWHIAKLNSPRALAADEIALTLFEMGLRKEQIVICDSIKDAYEKTKCLANDDDRIVAFGSFLVVEEICKSNKPNK